MKEMSFKIHLTKVIDEFSLEKIYASTDVDEVMIDTPEINRPALQIAGFYDYFDPKRLQVIGKVELTYLEQFGRDKRYELMEELLKEKFLRLF